MVLEIGDRLLDEKKNILYEVTAHGVNGTFLTEVLDRNDPKPVVTNSGN